MCMVWCMRTNIVLNEELIREARQYSRAASKRALVDEALQTYIAVKTRERQAASYRQRVQQLDQKLAGLVLRDRPFDLLRADRERT